MANWSRSSDGRPDFNLLQNYHLRGRNANIILYVFDILVLRNQSLMGLSFVERRTHLEQVVTPGPYIDVRRL